jgi:hypothetical protein
MATAKQLKKLRKKFGLGEFKGKVKKPARKTSMIPRSGLTAPAEVELRGSVRRIAGITVFDNEALLREPARPLQRFGGVSLVPGTYS